MRSKQKKSTAIGSLTEANDEIDKIGVPEKVKHVLEDSFYELSQDQCK